VAYVLDAGTKNIVGYRVTWMQNGKPRMRVFKMSNRATRFKGTRPFGSNAQVIPITRNK